MPEGEPAVLPAEGTVYVELFDQGSGDVLYFGQPIPQEVDLRVGLFRDRELVMWYDREIYEYSLNGDPARGTRWVRPEEVALRWATLIARRRSIPMSMAGSRFIRTALAVQRGRYADDQRGDGGIQRPRRLELLKSPVSFAPREKSLLPFQRENSKMGLFRRKKLCYNKTNFSSNLEGSP